MAEAAELYDLDDFTNACEFWEYYEIIEAWKNHASIKKLKKGLDKSSGLWYNKDS
jgi:uncharacterized Zn finger protein